MIPAQLTDPIRDLTQVQMYQRILGLLIEDAAGLMPLPQREALWVFLGRKRDVLLPVDHNPPPPEPSRRLRPERAA